MITSHRFVKSFVGLAMLLPAIFACRAFGSLTATATITTSQSTAPFTYTITLNNTGTSNIGTFWFAWTAPPNEDDFLPTSPSSVSGPANWIEPIIHNPAITGDGYSLEMYNSTGSSPITPGHSGTFQFTTTDTPTQLAGDAFVAGHKITESVIYAGFPESGSGTIITASILVPEPTSLALLGVGICTVMRRRSRI